MNKSDSERIATVLEDIGYKKASEVKEADLLVINMCSVRQSAVDRVYGKILKAKNKKTKILLTGCILKSDFKKFKENADYILPIKTLPYWKEVLKKEKYIYYPNQRNEKFNKRFDVKYFHIPPKIEKKFSVFVPISTGCNNFCSYCVVPFTRGPLICRRAKDILREVGLAVKNGAKEVWLLGQNVNDYQSNLKCQNSNVKTINFADLLKMVNEIKGNFWIRFTSPHPKNFSDELIDVMATCEKITPYLNLPVQSGDDEILKRMNRNYTVLEYKNLVKKIRDKIPKVCLSTDVIVGFPGERKKHFENTVKLFKEIKYDMAYIAKYSPRPQTTAFKLKDDVSQKEKEKRYKILSKILKEMTLEKNKKYLRKAVEVLVQEKKNSFYLGKTKTYKSVKFKVPLQKSNLVGQFVKVKIIDVDSFGLKGVLV